MSFGIVSHNPFQPWGWPTTSRWLARQCVFNKTTFFNNYQVMLRFPHISEANTSSGFEWHFWRKWTISDDVGWCYAQVRYNFEMNLLGSHQLTSWLKNQVSPLDVKFMRNNLLSKISNVGSGCGAVGRAVAYDTRGPGFDSSHRQLLLNIYLLLTVCRKDENKEKRPGMAHLFKKISNVGIVWPQHTHPFWDWRWRLFRRSC